MTDFDETPPVARRSLRGWMILLIVWFFGLIIWSLYLIALGYLLTKVL